VPVRQHRILYFLPSCDNFGRDYNKPTISLSIRNGAVTWTPPAWPAPFRSRAVLVPGNSVDIGEASGSKKPLTTPNAIIACAMSTVYAHSKALRVGKMGWKETRLWAEILARANDSASRTLQNCLPDIESVLRSGGTAALDFTLHDDQHSFRVAERIFDLIGDRLPYLSVYELSLVLLSAYTHDIGMSPSRDKVQSHYRFLLSGDNQLLDQKERDALQLWLDENWSGVTIPLKGVNSVSGLSLAEEVCAYYCRAMHNDWSEEWIKGHLPGTSPGLYVGWTDDLITLCKSHHEGYSSLIEARFDARLVSSPATSLNPRFLAALLRLADVMEFDPERTPSIVLTHRNIAPKSRVYWYRDHAISFEMQAERNELIFSARTPNAVIHKAVLSVAEMVNDELLCCHQLHQQGAFQRGVISDREKYIWKHPARLVVDVKERDESFTYIEGTFRPDVGKLLELLSGTQLYANPLAAVRELVQNAADAVAEQIGYERLQKDDAGNPSYERAYAELHRIKLTFEKIGDRFWLRCADDGVGLNKRLIESRLLVSGARNRPEFRALQREATSRGFNVFRTGQFGIGLLSYFMIADRVEFETKRSDESRGGGETAWKFVTEGIASFGELTRSKRSSHGTEVRLQLREDQLGASIEEWFERFKEYLLRTVRRLPCKLELTSSLATPSVQWSVGPGWTTDTGELSQSLLESFEQNFLPAREKKLSSIAEEEYHERIFAHWQELKEQLAKAHRWYGPILIETDALSARYWLPYYELSGGASLGFLSIEDTSIKSAPNGVDVITLPGTTILSWKGFRISSSPIGTFGIFVVDLRSGANPSISRSNLRLDKPQEIVKLKNQMEKEALDRFLGEHVGSQFHLLNRQLARKNWKYRQSFPDGLYWKKITTANEGSWTKFTYPFAEISLAAYSSDSFDWRAVQHKGIEVPLLARLHRDEYEFVHASADLGGGRLALLPQQYGLVPVSLWLSASTSRALFSTTEFPPTWKNMVFVNCNFRMFWNGDHPLVKLVNEQPDVVAKKASLEDRLLECLDSKALAARFLLSTMDDHPRIVALRDRFPDEFKRLMALLGADASPVYCWKFDSIFGEDNCTIMIAGNEIGICKRPYNAKFELVLPDATTLPTDDEDFVVRQL
jgi:hypothetical protein